MKLRAASPCSMTAVSFQWPCLTMRLMYSSARFTPAGKGGVAVDHQDLPVVPVVVVGGDERGDGGEGLAADAQFPQPLRVVAGKRGQLAGPVRTSPARPAPGRFAGQDLQDAAPHEAFVHDEILQENEPLRLFQLPQQFLELLLAQGEIGHSRVLVGREGAAPVQVAGERRGAGGLLFQPLHGIGGGGEQVLGLLHHVGGPVPQGAVAQVALGEQVHQGAEHRQERDDQKPGELCRGVQPAVQKIQHHGHGKEDRASENVGRKSPNQRNTPNRASTIRIAASVARRSAPLVAVHPPQRLVDGPGGFPQADDPPNHAHQPHGLGARAQKRDAHDRQDDVRADPLGLVLQEALVPQVRRAVHNPRDQHDAAQQEGQYARHMGGKEKCKERPPAKNEADGILLICFMVSPFCMGRRARDRSCPRRPAKVERCPTFSIATNRCFVIRFRSGDGKESGRFLGN